MDSDCVLNQAWTMTAVLHLIRRDAARSLARFYRRELCPTLFGEVVLVRQWGRIGTSGRRSETVVADQEEGRAVLSRWSRQKRARGYSIYEVKGPHTSNRRQVGVLLTARLTNRFLPSNFLF